MTTRPRRSPWLLALAALSACGAAHKDTEPLELSVRVYNDGIRWERFDDAALRLPPADRDDFLDQRDRLSDDLRVHHYEVVRVRHGPDGKRARVHVKYRWYLESNGILHETHTVQRWQRQQELWMMVGEDFLRGDPMPGVADPDAEPDRGDGEDAESELPVVPVVPDESDLSDAPR
ncbi:hypothetical protein [Haliangium sp.]|uniref:hypothetical protein n=1 Tax=Haliangium sp. TaxID=2663208 RepID=UPI003D130646